MRFIGNKELIMPAIKALLEDNGLTGKGLTIFDAFCGTGAVSDYLKDTFNLVSNDMLEWCVTYTRGRVCANRCIFTKLGFDPFEYFNSEANSIDGFFFKNYSHGGSERMYFTPENAGRIDYIRSTIEHWKKTELIDDDEYSLLLASLIESVSTVSNTAGVYGAFLKHWDSRALKPIVFKKVKFNPSSANTTLFHNAKVEDIISKVDCDILYLDPPYTQNQYGTQYHLLETLVRNDHPEISKITGSRSTSPMRSDWSKDYKSHILFDKILAKTEAKYIIFSYSKDGLMSKSYIEACMKRYGKSKTYSCIELDYKKYTNFKSRSQRDHFEYLFFIEKKPSHEVLYESPLNYIGSKAKMASLLKKAIPNKPATFVDAFGGGFNVGINIDANKLIYNDVNHFVSELVASFSSYDTYQYILFIKRTIKRFKLEARASEAYTKVREHYNSLPISKRDPKLLYCVILYGFNQQIRFNSDHRFNNPVGMRWFNDKVLEKLISFSRVLKEKAVVFEHLDYTDLLQEVGGDTFYYLDPPYMLTTGAYNDGKRGFHGWDLETERRFLNFCDMLEETGRHFMVSYVIEHKGRFNQELQDWIDKGKYILTEVNPDLGNNRKEILITNYEILNERAPLPRKKQIPEASCSL